MGLILHNFGYYRDGYEAFCLLGYKRLVVHLKLREIILEEYRLLGYKIPVLISKETHWVSATRCSLSMLSKI